MRGTLPTRRSRLADWARLAGALSLPVILTALLGAQSGLVDAPALRAALLLGASLAALALALAVSALASIWASGALGARSAGLAILYSSPVLAGMAAGLAALVVYPRLDDVSTDPIDPPIIAVDGAAEEGPSQQEIAAQLIAYPDLSSRLYDRPLADVHAAAVALVEERGWTVQGDGQPRVGAVEGALQIEVGPAGNETPDSRVVAVVPFPLLGFSGLVALRTRETPDGTRLDMRSTWGGGAHDFGQNARRIRAFLADLDEKLGARAASS